MANLTFSEYKPAITALNIHAGVKWSQHKVGSEKFYELFAEFIKLLKASESGESYLDDEEPSSLERAYESFILCADDEVSDRVSLMDVYSAQGKLPISTARDAAVRLTSSEENQD